MPKLSKRAPRFEVEDRQKIPTLKGFYKQQRERPPRRAPTWEK